MTEPIDNLRQAVQEYAAAVSDHPVMVTDFVMLTAAVNPATMDETTHFIDAASGAYHSCVGLCVMLADRFDSDGDDE